MDTPLYREYKSMSDLSLSKNNSGSPFDSIRRTDEDGEFWIARELMPLLGYQQWRQFSDAIERAIAAQENSGNATHKHFLRTIAKTDGRPKEDYRLSRLAAYLTAMNGDPRKLEVAGDRLGIKIPGAGCTHSRNPLLYSCSLKLQLWTAYQ